VKKVAALKRDDDPSKQGYGTLTTAGGACTALITGNRADGSAIMGSGVMEAGARLCLIQRRASTPHGSPEAPTQG
jgi:hypothetical protein